MGDIWCSNTATIPSFPFTTINCTTTTLSTCNPSSPSIDILCQMQPVVNITDGGEYWDGTYDISYGEPPFINSNKITGIRSAIFIPHCAISDSVKILDVSIQTIFNHSYMSDLEVYLEHATIPTLLFGGSCSVGSGCPNIIISDSSPNDPICDPSIRCNTCPDAKPVTMLSVYNNVNVNGYWYLYIFDYLSFEIGTFNEWTVKLELNTCPECSCSDSNSNSNSNSDSNDLFDAASVAQTHEVEHNEDGLMLILNDWINEMIGYILIVIICICSMIMMVFWCLYYKTKSHVKGELNEINLKQIV